MGVRTRCISGRTWRKYVKYIQLFSFQNNHWASRVHGTVKASLFWSFHLWGRFWSLSLACHTVPNGMFYQMQRYILGVPNWKLVNQALTINFWSYGSSALTRLIVCLSVVCGLSVCLSGSAFGVKLFCLTTNFPEILCGGRS